MIRHFEGGNVIKTHNRIVINSTRDCHTSISFLYLYSLTYFNLQEVRPTAFVGVPRVWEKFKEKVESQLRETTGIKEFILSKARVRGESMGEMTCVYPRMCGFVDVFFFFRWLFVAFLQCLSSAFFV